MRKRQASKNHKRIELQSGPSTSSQNAGGIFQDSLGGGSICPKKNIGKLKII
jgi:hypothetical protein